MGRVVRFRRRGRSTRTLKVLAAGAALGAILGYASLDVAPLMPLASGDAVCNIKGNISMTGERIYHMPGQRYYNQTVISPSKGERYFCSQWDAWWAGWRKSKV